MILTQEPMKTTLQPFFSMLVQEHKNFIVAIEEVGVFNSSVRKHSFVVDRKAKICGE